MAEVASAFVSLLPSGRGFGKGVDKEIGPDLDRAGKSGGKRLGSSMAGSFKTVIGPALALIGTAAVGSFLKGSIDAASDLSESTSKVGVVFGKQANQILSASKKSATAMGLTQQAYLEATGSLGNLLVSLDIAPKKAAGLSQEMVKLAGDLASFNNTSPEEALAALQSGLTGETEPLKRFGVNMNDATLRAEALKLGLIDSVKDGLSPQAKALAAQSLIMDQTKTAQGDFARTSGGLANQQRILSAEFGNLKATLGTQLLPIATKFATFLSKDFIPALYEIPPFFRSLKQYTAPVIGFFKSLVSGSGESSSKISMFRQTVASVFASIKQIFTSTISIVTSLWNAFGSTIVQYLSAALTNVQMILRGAFNVIAGIFKTVAALLKGDWQGVWDGIKQILRGAVGILVGLVRQLWATLRAAFRAGMIALKGIITGLASGVVDGITSLGSKIKSAAGTAFQGLKDKAKEKGQDMLDYVGGLPGKILTTLGNVAGLLFDAGKQLIQGFIDGIKGKFGDVKNTLGDLTGSLTSWKGPESLDRVILTPNGRMVVDGFISGLESQYPRVEASLGGLTDSLRASVRVPSGARLSADSIAGMGGSADSLNRADIERLIEATEAARVFMVGQRQFAEAVQAADKTIGRKR